MHYRSQACANRGLTPLEACEGVFIQPPLQRQGVGPGLDHGVYHLGNTGHILIA